jgi:hypothetical protein
VIGLTLTEISETVFDDVLTPADVYEITVFADVASMPKNRLRRSFWDQRSENATVNPAGADE